MAPVTKGGTGLADPLSPLDTVSSFLQCRVKNEQFNARQKSSFFVPDFPRTEGFRRSFFIAGNML